MGVAEIIGLIGAATKIVDYIAKLKKTAERTGAWTPEERAKVNSRWKELMESHAWATDDEEIP